MACSISMSQDSDTEVSLNLYDMEIEQAIRSISSAAGLAVEKRNDSYFIVDRDDVGQYGSGGPTELRTFKVQYTAPEVIEGILTKHLSKYGTITTLPQRRLLVVEDTPSFLNRIGRLLNELDRKPKQIYIEAKILEIGLKQTESFGLDWAKIFRSDGGEGTVGTQRLSTPGSPGLFFELVTPNVEVFLEALKTRDRLRTLSSPKILAMEDQEAETIIGDRQGYNITTTVENVTTTSVAFLESGVILRVKPSVDEANRILLEIHPEVSTGSVSDDGIPTQTTTEVSTTMLVESGETVFIGGLIKHNTQQTREGVPILGDVPLLGRLFSNKAISSINTELVVLITPYIIDPGQPGKESDRITLVRQTETDLVKYAEEIERDMEASEIHEYTDN